MNKFNNVIFGQKAFVINQDNQLLILKRTKDTDVFHDSWDVPGGKVENDDSLYDSLVREIKEETNMELMNIITILTTSRFRGDKQDSPWIFRNTYLVEAKGEVKLSSEHSKYKWISTAEIDDYNFPTDKDFREALNTIKSRKELLEISQVTKII